MKDLYARHLSQGVDIAKGDLSSLCDKAKELNIRVILGVSERVNKSLYCSAVHIAPDGVIVNVHRKTKPTFHEKLLFSDGDGNGLKVINAEDTFNISALICWENWLPLLRASLYAQGADLHVALFPNKMRVDNPDIAKFVALEAEMGSGGFNPTLIGYILKEFAWGDPIINLNIWFQKCQDAQ